MKSNSGSTRLSFVTQVAYRGGKAHGPLKMKKSGYGRGVFIFAEFHVAKARRTKISPAIPLRGLNENEKPLGLTSNLIFNRSAGAIPFIRKQPRGPFRDYSEISPKGEDCAQRVFGKRGPPGREEAGTRPQMNRVAYRDVRVERSRECNRFRSASSARMPRSSAVRKASVRERIVAIQESMSRQDRTDKGINRRKWAIPRGSRCNGIQPAWRCRGCIGRSRRGGRH